MDASDDDHEFDEIVSPLASNAKLEEMVSAFAIRRAELAQDDFRDGDASERHFDEVERLADHLGYRDYVGGRDQWGWAAMFLSDESFRDLYPSDRHWLFDDFIRDDVTEFLNDQNWEIFARTRMTAVELGNLTTVLTHLNERAWGPQMLRLQRLAAT